MGRIWQAVEQLKQKDAQANLFWGAVIAAGVVGLAAKGAPESNGGGSNEGYQGTSGTHYQYDLSKPGDQVRYSIDAGAQLRDSINVNPGVALDRGLGQVGGGIQK